MKMNLDLAKEILQTASSTGFHTVAHLSLSGYSAKEIARHVLRLADAGYIETSRSRQTADPKGTRIVITPRGLRFAALAHDHLIWTTAKSIANGEGALTTVGALEKILEEAYELVAGTESA